MPAQDEKRVEEHRQALKTWADSVRVAVLNTGAAEEAKAITGAIAQYEKDRFILAVVGKAKRGKSTLINALLGRQDDQLAPIDKLPATSAVSRFFWSDSPEAVVHFRPGGQKDEKISYARIGEYATEEFNPKNVKGVDLIDISGPFTAFDRDVVLVDTPGAAAACI